MANEIIFKFKSNAPWSESELNGLFEDFMESAKIDDDFIEGSESISIVSDDADQAEAEKAKIQAAAVELIANGALSISIDFKDENNNELYSNSFDVDDV